MSWLFLYAIVLALPWRLSILFQLFDPRSTKDGVDFYGRPSNFNFHHIPRRGRWTIAVMLMCNVILQLVQSTLYIHPWNNVWDYFKQPNGTILLVTGPVQGCIFGGGAAAVQIYWETKLYEQDPERFEPSIFNTVVEVFKARQANISYKKIFEGICACNECCGVRASERQSAAVMDDSK